MRGSLGGFTLVSASLLPGQRRRTVSPPGPGSLRSGRVDLRPRPPSRARRLEGHVLAPDTPARRFRGAHVRTPAAQPPAGPARRVRGDSAGEARLDRATAAASWRGHRPGSDRRRHPGAPAALRDSAGNRVLGRRCFRPHQQTGNATQHQERDHIERLIRGALGTGAAGVNVLLYGPPGTGKTEFCKVLAERLGVTLNSVTAGGIDEMCSAGCASTICATRGPTRQLWRARTCRWSASCSGTGDIGQRRDTPSLMMRTLSGRRKGRKHHRRRDGWYRTTSDDCPDHL